MRFFFKVYRIILSPILHAFTSVMSANPNTGCKFVPTCSEYSEQAIQKYGLLLGSKKSIQRICKCHPFSKAGGLDPV
ncbi:MAG: membrane protein insertion efficiency factor YidD [Bdellovibrionales bacterium]|nr:membrane protein insertion efficiency factor YidD [Bdellovibrionales bacterium]